MNATEALNKRDECMAQWHAYRAAARAAGKKLRDEEPEHLLEKFSKFQKIAENLFAARNIEIEIEREAE